MSELPSMHNKKLKDLKNALNLNDFLGDVLFEFIKYV